MNMKCVICNNESNNRICSSCIDNNDIDYIINFVRKIKDLEYEEYRNIISELSNNYESPLKEYCMIMSNVRKYYRMPKINQSYLTKNARLCLESDLISDKSKNIIKTLLLDMFYKNYQFEYAEKMASMLRDEMLDELSLYTLGDYYTITRRYNLAEKLLENAIMICNDDESMKYITDKLVECQDRRKGSKADYLPSNADNKKIYQNFMKKLSISVNVPISRTKAPEKIDNLDYPMPVELTSAGFKSFVAFDIESTGIDYSKDSITEIAAIRVVDGVVVETKEFVFQELVHPYKVSIPENVERITGITNEMVYNAREVWDVFKDFAEFIKDDILVGYNCMAFDSKFLRRAGRLSNIVINNKYFDVMKYVKKFENKLNYSSKTLTSISEILGIVNPQAHRALADSITTAKVYLKLLELDDK